MNKLPADLPDRLKAAGLKVVVVGDWHDNGRPASTGSFSPVGVLNHHTGSRDEAGDPADDLSYAKWLFYGEPRNGLPKPLCHVGLSYEGVVYLGAAGRANHAGEARASGSVAAGDGNRLYVGIEWMLSGTQPIPETMYNAGVTLNAVLLETLGSSVQAISCHYQTSTTGKWDIGDPNGIPFNGTRVFNVPAFRAAVKESMRKKRVDRGWRRVTLQHTSMQFSDSRQQVTSDAKKIFSRESDICTGTEVAGAGAFIGPILKAEANRQGYRYCQGGDTWIAVAESLVSGGWTPDHIPVLDANEGAFKHSKKGLTTVSFNTEELGRIHVGSAHYLTKGAQPGDPNFALNREYAEVIGKWARESGKGSDIVFYGGDQNINDRLEDTFFGSPLTSIQDELERWPGTGHGPIDVIASFDRDARVEGLALKVLDDSELPLHTDHFLLQATYKVQVI